MVENRWCKRDFRWAIGGKRKRKWGENNFGMDIKLLLFSTWHISLFCRHRLPPFSSISSFIIPRAIIRIQFTFDVDWATHWKTSRREKSMGKFKEKWKIFNLLCVKFHRRQVKNEKKAKKELCGGKETMLN